MPLNTITPESLHKQILAGQPIDLIDVRSPQEYHQVHVPGARLVPLDALSVEAVLTGRLAPDGEPIYVICHSGGRSRTACARLTRQGLSTVVNVEGGTSAWQQAGLPVERSA